MSWHSVRRSILLIVLPVEISFGLSEEIRHSKGSVSSFSPPHVRDNLRLYLCRTQIMFLPYFVTNHKLDTETLTILLRTLPKPNVGRGSARHSLVRPRTALTRCRLL